MPAAPLPPLLSPEHPGPDLPMGPARILYLAMLDLLDASAIRRFWQAHPLERDGQELSEAELYKALWGHVGTISAYYCQSIWNDAEEFLNEHGVAGEGLIKNKIWTLSQQGMWKASHVLDWIKELLPQLYRDPNPRLTLLHVLGRWAVGSFPGSLAGVPFHRSDGEWTEAVSSWAPSSDFSFRFYYAVDLHSTPFHRVLPTYFGLPQYEHTRIIADCRPPDFLVRDEPVRVTADRFFVGSRCIGQLVAFSDWSRDKELDLGEIPVPDQAVIRIDEDFFCPRRQRPVLLAGCVYGAPMYLARFRFKAASPADTYAGASDYLTQIIADMLRSEEGEWGPFDDVHRAVLSAAEERLDFEFVKSADALRVNGKTLFRGVPARLLHKVLRGYLEGRSTFEYLSFKHDPDLFHDPKRTSFEVRLQRVREKLERLVPGLSLERIREGEFSIKASCPVSLNERD